MYSVLFTFFPIEEHYGISNFLLSVILFVLLKTFFGFSFFLCSLKFFIFLFFIELLVV